MKTLKIFTLVACVAALASFTMADKAPAKVEKKVETNFAHFKLVNDTGNKVRIHTGYGVVSLNKRGGSTSVTCRPGKKVYTAPRGSKDKFLFKVTSGMCGKTVKLSKYL
ncbi:hypothetical protein [uncultured Microscilla sp.]|uniref:hypothetical protein n=1 Tax=uncultured Microscilla sp. TaxID=432653 RepID=UPI00262B6E3F|nr:hypothetical protein [uncultured Microscilla sp.]